MFFLLNASDIKNEKPYTEDGLTKLGDIFANGGQWFLLGMLTVFAVLGLIWVCLEIFHRCFSNSSAPKIKEEPEAPSPVVRAPKPVAPPVPTTPVATTDDEEIVAVIAAAIEAAKAESPNGLFRVVSFRKR